MKIGFIGFQKAGKSTVGSQVAQLLNLPFVDLDELVRAHFAVATPAHAFRQFGEKVFRQAELELFESQVPAVVAFGGGSLDAIEKAHQLGYVLIYLYRPFDEILEELKDRLQAGDRPAWLHDGELSEVFALTWNRRHPMYSSCAQKCMYSKRGSITDMVQEVVGFYGKQ